MRVWLSKQSRETTASVYVELDSERMLCLYANGVWRISGVPADTLARALDNLDDEYERISG